MSATTVESLTEYADELLALAALALNDTVGGAIDRQSLTAGSPSFDCEQITVEVSSVGDAPLSTLSPLGAGSRHMRGAVNLIGFRITVVRDCIATIDEDGNFPDPIDMRADAVRVHQDVWAIWTKVRSTMADGDLFGGRCSKLFFDGARSLPIEGGTAGWTIDFRANLPGFVNSGT